MRWVGVLLCGSVWVVVLLVRCDVELGCWLILLLGVASAGLV